ncbi:DUF6049 family protein [Acrocarpospora catenulata]|uniref:DUF6049 family protein n=1 Tax=Acrocarpospora catenulata TaxID=2836182 RepID=UPI001BDA3F68|nr:DUF6049 family protein [Acrocarpospora catenulata]
MRRLVSALIAAWFLAPGLAIAAPPASAIAVVDDPLVVEELTPETPREPTTPITISGVVTGTPGSTIRIRLRYAIARPFQTRADLEAYATGQLPATNGYDTRIQATPLDANGKLSFSLTVTPAQLRFAGAGVYPLVIEVVDGTVEHQIAVERTFIPYLPAGTELSRTRVAVALPLVDRQRRADDATFMDEDLLGDGRLNNLLAVAEKVDQNATWFVDPALLDDADRLSREHRVINNARAKPGDSQAAGGWLSSLRDALANNPVVAMPYADPDVAALVHNGLDDTTGQALAQGSSVASRLLKRQIPATTVWPTGGLIDRDALDELSVNGTRTVLLDGSALPPANPADATAAVPAAAVDTVRGELTAQLADPVLGRLLATDTTVPGAELAARQRFLAETALLALTQPRKRPATVILAPPDRLWNPDPDFVGGLLTTVPWLRPITLDSVQPGRTPRTDLVYPPQAREAELPKSYMTTVRKLSRKADVAALVPASGAKIFNTAVMRLASASWRGDGDAAAFAQRVDQAVDERVQLVSVVKPENRRSVAGTNGRIPVSVQNGMNEDVQVALRVKSTDPDLLAVEGGVYITEAAEVAQGKTQSFDVPVTVVGDGGQAALTVQLLTADGRAFGKPARLAVSATGYTGIALVIVGAAVVIMLAAVVMRIMRRRAVRTRVRPAAVHEQREPQEA